MDSDRDYFRFVIPLNPNQNSQGSEPEPSSEVQSQQQSNKVIDFQYQTEESKPQQENRSVRFESKQKQLLYDEYPSLTGQKCYDKQSSSLPIPPPNLHQTNAFTLYSSRRGKHSNLNSGIASNINLHSKQTKGSNQYALNLTIVETFNTLQDFFYIYGSIRSPSECPIDTKIFFFKKECKPIWEEWLDSGCLLLQFRNNNKVETIKNENLLTKQDQFQNQQSQAKDSIIGFDANPDIQNEIKIQAQSHKNASEQAKNAKVPPKQKDTQGLIDHIWQFLLFHLIGNLLHTDVIGICLCKRQKITLIEIWLSKQNQSKNIGQQIQYLIQKQITSLVCPGSTNSSNEQQQKFFKNSQKSIISSSRKGPNYNFSQTNKLNNRNSKNSSISQVIPYTSSTSGIVSVKYKRHRDSINSQSTMKGALNLPLKTSKKKDLNRNQKPRQSSKNDKHFGFFRPVVFSNLNQTF